MQLAAILYDIRSVHNVGSIFRTADGAGFEKLYLCNITPSPVDRFKKVRPDFAKVASAPKKRGVGIRTGHQCAHREIKGGRMENSGA